MQNDNSRRDDFLLFHEKERSSDFMTFPSVPKIDEQKIFEGYLFMVAMQNSVVMHVSLRIQILIYDLKPKNHEQKNYFRGTHS